MTYDGIPAALFFPANSQGFELRALLSINGCGMVGARVEPPLALEKRISSNMEEELELSEDDGWREKKRRLSSEQVRTLERNFELGKKLEPERKMELAAALGLHPRQVSIWFQNRRARWKTKRLEKDHEELKRQLGDMKAENESLKAHNKKLLCELLELKGKEISESINLNKETKGSSCSIWSENSSSAINFVISRAPTSDSPSELHQGRNFFPSYRPPSAPQRPATFKQETPKIGSSIQEENLCNMFCATDDESAFWAWSDQHN